MHLQLLAAAAAGANLRLVGLAPSPGAAPEGPPLQAEAIRSFLIFFVTSEQMLSIQNSTEHNVKRLKRTSTDINRNHVNDHVFVSRGVVVRRRSGCCLEIDFDSAVRLTFCSIALEAEEGKTPVALQHLDVLEEVARHCCKQLKMEIVRPFSSVSQYLRHIWKIGHNSFPNC